MKTSKQKMQERELQERADRLHDYAKTATEILRTVDYSLASEAYPKGMLTDLLRCKIANAISEWDAFIGVDAALKHEAEGRRA